MIRPALIFILLAALFCDADARDPAAVREFRAENPCPLTGKTTGPCEIIDGDGRVVMRYVVDHQVPLCAGGPDDPSNMAWQEYRASLIKDAHERRLCARMRKTCGH